MAGENIALRDIGVSHQIGLRRLSTGIRNKIVGLLDNSEADIIAQLEKLDPGSVQGRYTRGRLDKLLISVRELNKDVYKGVGSTIKDELVDLAKYETSYQAGAVGSIIGVMAPQFNLPTPQQLVSTVTDEPFNGRLLKEWVSGLEEGRFSRLRDAIRFSVVEGEQTRDTVKRIIGTKEMNYKDGITEMSRRSATAMVRTAVNHTANSARQLMYEENADVLDGWQFVAVLDDRTTPECQALDGQIFKVGEGPYPPRHINCRSTSVPVVKGGGDVQRTTYAEWLKNQPPEVQDEALGKAKAELYRSGGLTLDKFVDDLGRPLTLDELRQIEPQAFAASGLVPEVLADLPLPVETTTFGKWESGLGVPLTEKQQAKVTELALNTPGLSNVLPYMSSDEAARLNKANVAKIVSAFENYPSPDEMAAIAYSGRAKRGWYEHSANAIVEVFGAQDAPRFAAMMAGMSPQTSVESNAVNSLNMWTNWINAGRPTDKDSVVKLLGQSVQGEKGAGSVLPSWINNTVRALSAADPEAIVLSGPKVNSFALNLRDHVNAVTLDTWMANFANMSPDDFRKAGGALPGKGGVYTGVSAAIRKAAETASNLTGETWTPAEIQETVWSWARTLSEKADAAGEDRTALQLLKAGGMTWNDIKDTPDFEVLFTQGVYRNILEKGGYGEGVAVAARGAAARAGATAGGDILSAEGSGITQDAFTRHLNRAASRLDALREAGEIAPDLAATSAANRMTVDQAIDFMGKVTPAQGLTLGEALAQQREAGIALAAGRGLPPLGYIDATAFNAYPTDKASLDAMPGVVKRRIEHMQKAVAAIPEEHQKLFDNEGLTLSVVPTIDIRDGQAYGLYEPHPGGVVNGIASPPRIQVAMEAGGHNLWDPVGTTTHELGHALSYAQKGEFTDYVAKAVTEEAYKAPPESWIRGLGIVGGGTGMTKEERYAADHYLSSPKEMFAELYRLAYSPSGAGAFGMPKDRAEQVFSKSLSVMKSVAAHGTNVAAVP